MNSDNQEEGWEEAMSNSQEEEWQEVLSDGQDEFRVEDNYSYDRSRSDSLTITAELRNSEELDEDLPDEVQEEELYYRSIVQIQQTLNLAWQNEDQEDTLTINNTNETTLEGFDTSLTNLHTYLGRIEDLESLTGRRLQEHTTVCVPCLELEGVVMVPGMSLPLTIDEGYEGQMIRNALRYHGQSHGWIGVTQTFNDHRQYTMSLVGCLAKIQQISRSDQGELRSCIAVGRHRMRIIGDVERVQRVKGVECEVLPDLMPPPIPKEITQNCAFWNLKVAKLHDCYHLAKQVFQIVRETMPQVQEFRGNPVELSYWCIQNLPFSNKLRQQLLEVEVSQRLRTIISRSKSKNLQICCELCGLKLGKGSDIIAMSDTGPGGVFVNPGGYVHDVITLRAISGATLWSRPSTENSWFPGYAWTILNCRQCLRHLGWKFTAVKQLLMPQMFYGLRHGTITLLRVEENDSDESY